MSWLDDAVREYPGEKVCALPVRYQYPRLESLPHEALRAVVTRYLADFWALAEVGRAPLFLGKAQEGKTFAAALIAKTVAAAGIETTFVSCPDAFMRLDLNRFGPGTAARLTQWGAVPFLVLDDLFQLAVGSWSLATATALLFERFNACRPTIVTGNLELPQGAEFAALGQQFGVPLARRLQESAEGFTVLL